MIKDRTSLKRPLIAALVAALLGMLYAAGYRGKYNPAAKALSAGEFIYVFVLVFGASFFISWLLQRLGVNLGFLDEKGGASKSSGKFNKKPKD